MKTAVPEIAGSLSARGWLCRAHAYKVSVKMPNSYSLDLRWRIVWVYLAQHRSPRDIAALLNVSERTVRRYITLFYHTGDVLVKPQRSGPERLLGDFE